MEGHVRFAGVADVFVRAELAFADVVGFHAVGSEATVIVPQ
jgi:hypothetical protein